MIHVICGSAKAPEGWECSRERGHEGPCAAHPIPQDALSVLQREAARLRSDKSRLMDKAVGWKLDFETEHQLRLRSERSLAVFKTEIASLKASNSHKLARAVGVIKAVRERSQICGLCDCDPCIDDCPVGEVLRGDP